MGLGHSSPIHKVGFSRIAALSDDRHRDNRFIDHGKGQEALDVDFPNWGLGSGNVSQEAFENDLVLKFPAYDFQGVQFPDTDLTGMTMLHLDIWAQTQGVGLMLIANGGANKSVNITSNDGEWSSVDIALSDFSGLDLSQIFQMKFYGLNGANADRSLDI